ncbi:class I SAM-dependent DNA methyltransferase [Peptostreptococcus porci]|uniref:class I SAM-dependent DNA methyltransferase n=1 Tax=Peptostreptococcus porci TaxID=2652282 RepID=UPI0023F39306|nr:class I SAM-dependent methyltransferase [Peptostreptococcus porci]MDD7183277.1 class I SAM-dependent methyltransferase [Peptostreptococcus porci]
MSQYENFAYIYDDLMDDVDYEMWVNHIEKIIKKSGSSVKNILELACGTGNITIPLARKGYDIAGVDISYSMLDVALSKSEEMGIPLVLLEQDIVELDFDLYDLDCVLCACDGFNYITEIDDLKKVFAKVYELLKKEGVFIFDISSYYKIKNILGNNFMGESRENLSYMWTNYFDEETNLIDMELDFFVKVEVEDDEEDNLYERYREVHHQRAYEESELRTLLKEVGFIDVEVFGDFNLKKSEESSQRLFFMAKK